MEIRGQKSYVQQLKRMLKKEKPCVWCPDFLALSEIASASQKPFICNDLCRNFVNLKPKDTASVASNQDYIFIMASAPKSRCPCLVLGKDRAIARAHEYLELWDSEEHHWQVK